MRSVAFRPLQRNRSLPPSRPRADEPMHSITSTRHPKCAHVSTPADTRFERQIHAANATESNPATPPAAPNQRPPPRPHLFHHPSPQDQARRRPPHEASLQVTRKSGPRKPAPADQDSLLALTSTPHTSTANRPSSKLIAPPWFNRVPSPPEPTSPSSPHQRTLLAGLP